MALFGLAVVVTRCYSAGTEWYRGWKTRRFFPGRVSAAEVLAAIGQHESDWLLSKPEARTLARAAEDMQSVEFDMVELLDDPTGSAKRWGIQATSYRQLFRIAIPLLAGRQERVDQHMRRLHSKGLVEKRDLSAGVAVGNGLPSITTQMGKKLAWLVRRLRQR